MRFLPLAIALLAGGLAAQQNIKWIENNVPSGSRNAFPWGSNFLRYQTIFDASMLGNLPGLINDIIVPGDTADPSPREVFYEDIEIRMGNTAVTHATIGSAWATNNPNPTTVYRGALRVVYEPNAWRGFGLPRPFLYIPLPATPNLCVEVITWKVRGYNSAANFFFPAASTSVYRAYLLNWTNSQTSPATTGLSGSKFGLLFNDGNYVVLGTGCNSSASQPMTIGGPGNAWPTRGQSFPISLSGARPSYPLLCAIGTSDQNWGPIQLPLALGPFGGGSCQVWSEPLLTIGFVSNSSGLATLPLAIPADGSLANARLTATWVQLDPLANQLGAALSGYMKLLLN